MSKRDDRYLRFWQGLHDYMAARRGPVAPPEPSDMNYVKCPPMRRGFRLCAAFDTQGRRRKVELLITGNRRDEFARLLMAQRVEIEGEVGSGLDWNIRLAGEKKISLWDERVDVLAGPLSNQYAWFAEKLELLHGVFAPRIGRL